MSQTASSKRARALIAASLAALALCACAKVENSASGVAGTTKPQGAVGYVRMDDLVRRHPLYAELARLDDDVAALQFKSVGGESGPSLPPDQLRKEQAAIQREFEAASKRAQEALKQKQESTASARPKRSAKRWEPLVLPPERRAAPRSAPTSSAS